MTRRRASRSRQLVLDLDRPVRIEVGRRTAWVRGVGRDLLESAGTPKMWDHLERCWTVPRQAADVVGNVARVYGREVAVTAVDR